MLETISEVWKRRKSNNKLVKLYFHFRRSFRRRREKFAWGKFDFVSSSGDFEFQNFRVVARSLANFCKLPKLSNSTTTNFKFAKVEILLFTNVFADESLPRRQEVFNFDFVAEKVGVENFRLFWKFDGRNISCSLKLFTHHNKTFKVSEISQPRSRNQKDFRRIILCHDENFHNFFSHELWDCRRLIITDICPRWLQKLW